MGGSSLNMVGSLGKGLLLVGVVVAVLAVAVKQLVFVEEMLEQFPSSEFLRSRYRCEDIGDTSDGVHCARERAPAPIAKATAIGYPIVGRTDKSLKTTLGFMADFGLLPHFNNESQTWVADDSGKPASSYYLRCRSSFGLSCIEIRRLPDTSVKAKHL